MKTNIDLTLNNDFRKKTLRRIKRLVDVFKPSDSSIIPERLIDKIPIPYTEQVTNFPTGSINEIKKKKDTVRLYRSLSGNDDSCDRCGKSVLFFKQNTLCQRCDSEMELQTRPSLWRRN